MGTSVIFFGILSGIIAAACAVLLLNISLMSAILVYSMVGSAITLTWVLALVSQDADLSDKGIN
ncbi:MAG: hypothetical protein KC448_07960 [Yoonia sp.]|nr:hypothetical protein [Yoonia sp.]